MPKITDHRRAQRREQILTAAMACVAQEGFHRTTMADVITASGLSAGAVYGYFTSKEDLILALADRAISSIEPVLAQLLHQDQLPTIAEAVQKITEHVLELSVAGTDLAPVAIAAWAEAARNEQVRDAVAQRLHTMRVHLTELARELQRRGRLSPEVDAEAVGQAAAGMLPGFLLQQLIFGDVEPARYAAGLAAISGID
ncbi:MAG: TetR/AcrR family transcriptional regulator [Beutenbergiaceae bacterium]